MKKIILALIVGIFVSSLCFAQEESASVRTFTGRVEAVSPGNAEAGISTVIVVVNDNGKSVRFVLKSDASITAKDGKTITPDKVKNGDKVIVGYRISNGGRYQGLSVRLVE